MPSVTIQVRKNADVILDIDYKTTSVTEIAFKLQQGNVSVVGSMTDGRVLIPVQNKIRVVIPRSQLSSFAVGPAEYDVIAKRGGVVETVQFGAVSVVTGLASVS